MCSSKTMELQNVYKTSFVVYWRKFSSLPGEVIYFHLQLVTRVKPNTESNTASYGDCLCVHCQAVQIQQCMFVSHYWSCLCECTFFMSSSELFPSESAFYSRISPGWVWLFDRTAPWRPPSLCSNEHLTGGPSDQWQQGEWSCLNVKVASLPCWETSLSEMRISTTFLGWQLKMLHGMECKWSTIKETLKVIAVYWLVEISYIVWILLWTSCFVSWFPYGELIKQRHNLYSWTEKSCKSVNCFQLYIQFI